MNKFLITIISIFFISSLANARGIKEMLINAVKTRDIQTVISILNDSNIEDKNMALAVARDVNFSDNDVLILASGLGLSENVRSLIEKGTNVNGKGVFGSTPLYEAIFNIRPEVVKILLSHPGLIVDKSDLDLAKEKFLEIKKLIENNFSQGKHVSVEILANKEKIRQIGRMLVNYLGLYTGQSRISKEGVIGGRGLPTELVTYIASFGNQ